MIETRFRTTSRSTPATSIPCLNAPSIAARMPKRNSATANEPAVSAVRVFLRNRFLTTRCRYFIVAGPPSAGRPRLRGLDQHALFQMEDRAGAARGQRVVRDHQRGLALIAHEAIVHIEQRDALTPVGAAGGVATRAKCRIGGVGEGSADALLLSEGELPRVVAHAIAQPRDLELRLDLAAADVLEEAG